tara:strand:+ start:640 stop:882 length:243 start_codon:yes stop_codon:yes gene_type:complete
VTNKTVTFKVVTIPTAKKYKETQYSTVKKRTGKESVPFLGLDSGYHSIRFINHHRQATLTIKTWISPYGYAWKVIPTIGE